MAKTRLYRLNLQTGVVAYSHKSNGQKVYYTIAVGSMKGKRGVEKWINWGNGRGGNNSWRDLTCEEVEFFGFQDAHFTN